MRYPRHHVSQYTVPKFSGKRFLGGKCLRLAATILGVSDAINNGLFLGPVLP